MPALEVAAEALIDEARACGANMHLAGGAPGSALGSGVESLILRGILQREGDAISIAAGEEDALGYYAASVLQRLSEPETLPGFMPAGSELPGVAGT